MRLDQLLGTVSCQADTPQHECGVFGAFSPTLDVARICYFGLFTLQHRGQESAGIAVSDGGEIVVHKQMGLVNQIFDEGVLSRLHGHLGIGHVRYSTTGSSVIRNAQPFLVGDDDFTVALAHNGNLVNSADLKHRLAAKGLDFQATSDTEIIAKLLHRELSFQGPIEDALNVALRQLRGAFSIVVLTDSELIAARDPHGLHPLCVGRLDHDSWVVASETCALSAVDAEYFDEVQPGEAVIIDEHGLRRHRFAESPRSAMCIFETIYFARPDSVIYGQSLHAVRRRMGEVLAQEQPAEADLVIGVPDTSIPGAIGYAASSRLPYDIGLVKSRYIQRTFIQPDQRLREIGARLKFTALRDVIAGRRVVVVDDSIVRGTTTRQLVKLIRDAGASEVHLRVHSPPIQWPCFYGIDMATREELIASSHDVDQIREHVGADSLGYLSTAGLARALGVSSKHFCWACLTGKYPIRVPSELREAKMQLENGHCDSLEDRKYRAEPLRIPVGAPLGEGELEPYDL